MHPHLAPWLWALIIYIALLVLMVIYNWCVGFLNNQCDAAMAAERRSRSC